MNGRRIAVSFIVLGSVYLLYLPFAEFVLDDWLLYDVFIREQAAGWPGQLRLARILIQNKLYNAFQLHWLSYLIDSVLVWMLGYAPRILFALGILQHVLNAWLLYRLLAKLRLSLRLAYLAAAGFLLAPVSHGPLFWFLANSYYVRAPFFLFLYLLSLAATLEKGTLAARAAVWQGLLVAAILCLAGGPTIGLVLVGGPWMALCFFPRQRWKLAAVAAALHWAVAAITLGIYVFLLNQIRPGQEQIAARYDFSSRFFWDVWQKIWLWHAPGLSGVGRKAYYHLQAISLDLLVAVAVGLVVGLVARRLADQGTCPPLRAALFAAGMLVLGYAPLAFLISMTLRHLYALSPYVALLSLALVWTVPRARLAAGPLLAAYFAWCTVAEMRQCWIPQSRHLQAVKAGLLKLKNLEAGDQIVLPRFPMVTGTAPNFALIQAPWDQCFARHVTGVPGLGFWREIVVESGQLRVFHRHYMRDTSLAELGRTHLLLGEPDGPYTPIRYWAEPVAPGQVRLRCFKDEPCEPSAITPIEKFRADHHGIYFPKPFDQSNWDHRHY